MKNRLSAPFHFRLDGVVFGRYNGDDNKIPYSSAYEYETTTAVFPETQENLRSRKAKGDPVSSPNP